MLEAMESNLGRCTQLPNTADLRFTQKWQKFNCWRMFQDDTGAKDKRLRWLCTSSQAGLAGFVQGICTRLIHV